MDTWLLLSLTGAVCAIAFAAVAVTALLGSRLVRTAARRRAESAVTADIDAAARQLGMQSVGEGTYEGRVQGRRVRWSLREVDYDADHPPRLQLALGTPIPSGQLGLTHRTMHYGAVPPDLELPLCRLGDAEFDVRFFAHADLEHLSLLTPSVRRALLLAGEDAEVRIRSSWLWIDHVATESLAAGVQTRLDWLFKAASAFEGVQAEVEQRVRKMTQDPVARVRERLLELLQQRAPSEFTTWIARTLSEDLDPAVRVRAAEILRDGERLGAMARDATLPGPARKRAGLALAAVGAGPERVAVGTQLARPPDALPDVALLLVADLPDHEAEPVLVEVVQAEHPGLARRALSRLVTAGSARSLVILQALADSEARPSMLRVEAKAALETLRRRRSNPPEAVRQPTGDTPVTAPPNLGPLAKEATRPLPSRPVRRRRHE
ncbi:MAG: hypothetical protein R3F59_17275 [Myxococcota bacterium]